jgi:4'-phosphopantetheinyl transferase EntD
MPIDIFPANPGTILEPLRLERNEKVFHAAFCLACPPWPETRDRRDQFLHAEEQSYFATLKFERRQISFLAGRYCAKRALQHLCPAAEPASFPIRPGVFQQPVVHGLRANLQVSISHAHVWAAAVAFPEEHPMAIDIEEVKADKADAIRSQLTPSEYGLVAPLAGGELRALTLLWTAKEAMAKVIRCGMMTPFTMFEIDSASASGRAIVSTFANFGQYKAISYFHENLAISLVSPRNTSIKSNLDSLF